MLILLAESKSQRTWQYTLAEGWLGKRCKMQQLKKCNQVDIISQKKKKLTMENNFIIIFIVNRTLPSKCRPAESPDGTCSALCLLTKIPNSPQPLHNLMRQLHELSGQILYQQLAALYQKSVGHWPRLSRLLVIRSTTADVDNLSQCACSHLAWRSAPKKRPKKPHCFVEICSCSIFHPWRMSPYHSKPIESFREKVDDWKTQWIPLWIIYTMYCILSFKLKTLNLKGPVGKILLEFCHFCHLVVRF